MSVLCSIRLHHWRVSRVQSNRYGALVTQTCTRTDCPATRTESRW